MAVNEAAEIIARIEADEAERKSRRTSVDPDRAAERMVAYIEAEERGRKSFYFHADGSPIVQGGRNFGKLVRSGRDAARSMRAALIVEYPFRPSLLSCADMVREHQLAGKSVIYNEERWHADRRVDEQIGVYGPDVVDDWKLEALMDALTDNVRKVAA